MEDNKSYQGSQYLHNSLLMNKDEETNYTIKKLELFNEKFNFLKEKNIFYRDGLVSSTSINENLKKNILILLKEYEVNCSNLIDFANKYLSYFNGNSQEIKQNVLSSNADYDSTKEKRNTSEKLELNLCYNNEINRSNEKYEKQKEKKIQVQPEFITKSNESNCDINYYNSKYSFNLEQTERTKTIGLKTNDIEEINSNLNKSEHKIVDAQNSSALMVNYDEYIKNSTYKHNKLEDKNKTDIFKEKNSNTTSKLEIFNEEKLDIQLNYDYSKYSQRSKDIEKLDSSELKATREEEKNNTINKASKISYLVLRLSKDKQFLEFLKENYDTNVFDNILNHKVEQEYINSIISLESEYDKKEKLKNSTPNSPPQNSYNFSDERGLNFNYNYLSPKDRHSPEKNIISNFSQYNYNKAIKNPNTSYYSPSNYSRLNVTSANLSYGFINQDYHKNSFCYYYDPITYERKRSKETSIKRYDRCFSPYYGLNKSNEQSFTNTFTKNLRKNISACMNTKLIGRIDTDSPLYKAKFTNYTSKKSNYFDRSIQYGGPSSVQRIEIKPDYSLAGRVKNLTK